MKNKYIKHLKYSVLLLLALVSCKDEYLDVDPIGIINSNSFYATQDDAEKAVTSVYGMLNYQQVWDLWILADLGSIASDDAEAGGATREDVAPFQEIDKFVFTPSLADAFKHPYGILYKQIFLANMALERLPDLPKKDTTCKQLFVDQRLAEVKFLRALAFFYLAQIYGEIPLVDHVLGASEYTMGRSSLSAVFDLMEKDLTEAVAVLPVSYEAANIGRVTKGAAQGLLAKVYLFESSYATYHPDDVYSLVNKGESRFKGLKAKWSDALSMAENAINSGQYKLCGIDGEKYKSWRGDNTDGFRYIWTTDGDNSKESVFEIQCGFYNLGWLNTRGSSMVWWTGARWIYDNKNNNKPTESKYWGFNVPTASLVAEFNKEKRLPGDPLYGSLSPADPRFNTTIHKDTIGGNDSINLVSSNGWYKICYHYDDSWKNLTEMYQAKYECSYDEYLGKNGGWPEAPMNNRILRYADVVLIAAEAALMSGDNDKARKYLNMVRTRARKCGVEGNTCPADYESGTTITLDMIIHERRLELAMEGHRFYDLVRWNQAEKYLSGIYLKNAETTSSFTPVKNDFFPIPQTEVNASQGNLLQYEGW